MHFKQLELNLWDNLEEAAAAPESANFNDLWQQLEAAIAPLPQHLQLHTAAECILKIVQIYASRSDWLLSSWEQAHNPEGPVVAQEMLAGLVRQTMTLDLTALLEAPEPEHRTRRTPSEPGSVVGTVDKAALLQVIEEIEAQSGEAVRCADPLSVAHSEDISQWTTAIARRMEQKCDGEAVSLIQLQQALGMPLVEVWLGLLLAEQGQYSLEQRGDFYEPLGIWLTKIER